MRPWVNKAEIKESVASIKTIYTTTGQLPAPLVQSYKHLLETLSPNFPGMVRFFYEELARECPEALKYFTY